MTARQRPHSARRDKRQRRPSTTAPVAGSALWRADDHADHDAAFFGSARTLALTLYHHGYGELAVLTARHYNTCRDTQLRRPGQ